MIRSILLTALLLSAPLFAEPLHLLALLQRAEAGDYLVTTEGKHQTVLLVRGRSDGHLYLDEITCPQKGHGPISWKGWIEEGAPGASTWLCHVIDLKTGGVPSCYSFTQEAWVDTHGQNWFLSTLLSLPLSKLPNAARRRIGPTTPSSSEDVRRLWQPRLIFEGYPVRGATFSAWHCCWPNDGSELAGQWIVLYLPEGNGPFPTYLPYWIELNDPMHAAKLRTVDSGKNARSSRRLPGNLAEL